MLIDDQHEMLNGLYTCFTSILRDLPSLLNRYDEMIQREAEEAKLTEEDLTEKEPENFDEWGQGYGRCPRCGTPWSIVRPGKGQPACDCEDREASDYTALPPEYDATCGYGYAKTE